MANRERSVLYDPTEGLESPEEIAEYLDVAMEEGDDRVLLMAPRNAVKAIGGMTELAKRTGLSRETLYRARSLSGKIRACKA